MYSKPSLLRYQPSLLEDLYRKSISNRLIPGNTRMQPITTIIPLVQLLRVRLIRNHTHNINREIIVPTLQNPLIHPLPRLLPFNTLIPITRKRRNCTADSRVTSRLRISSDLLERCDEAVADRCLRSSRVGITADVVDAFEDHDPFYAGLLDGIALVPCQEGRAETAAEDCVAAGGLVADGDVGVVCRLETGEYEVGPAAVVLDGKWFAGLSSAYRLFLLSSEPLPSVMLSPRTIREPVVVGT